MDFEARFEKIFKQSELFSFLVERMLVCRERLWLFGNSVNIFLEVCRIVVVCQLLKGQQSFVRFDRRRGILTEELRLIGRVVVFLLFWRCTRGGVSDFFVNTCQHVVALFLVSVLCRLVDEDARFRMRITLGFVLILSLACAKCISGRLPSGSGVALKQWVHEEDLVCGSPSG